MLASSNYQLAKANLTGYSRAMYSSPRMVSDLADSPIRRPLRVRVGYLSRPTKLSSRVPWAYAVGDALSVFRSHDIALCGTIYLQSKSSSLTLNRFFH